MFSRGEIQSELSKVLADLFDLSPEKITPGARLKEDLDLDSIDAVDLMARLQQYTGKRIPSAEFKSVRTVNDVVDKIYNGLAAGA
ncbi:MAG: acyl carrier protein [Candidatus Binataceae bacterium]|nr:acyl carrier protein [Candidatus Binataceae bacterium]